MVYSTAAAACLMSPFLSSCSFATHLLQTLQTEHDKGVVGPFSPLLQEVYQVSPSDCSVGPTVSLVHQSSSQTWENQSAV